MHKTTTSVLLDSIGKGKAHAWSVWHDVEQTNCGKVGDPALRPCGKDGESIRVLSWHRCSSLTAVSSYCAARDSGSKRFLDLLLTAFLPFPILSACRAQPKSRIRSRSMSSPQSGSKHHPSTGAVAKQAVSLGHLPWGNSPPPPQVLSPKLPVSPSNSASPPLQQSAVLTQLLTSGEQQEPLICHCHPNGTVFK